MCAATHKQSVAMTSHSASDQIFPDPKRVYFSTVRTEIEDLLPADAHRVLEVGCGAGATLAWLKQRWPDAWAAGADVNEEQVRRAAAHADQAERCDLDETLPSIAPATIDLLLCLDVLEHLRDPWAVLRGLAGLVRPGGRVIVSVPNVRHASVLLPLAARGRWRYGGSGILDQTHLRFFTRETAVELVRDAGFAVSAVRGVGTQPGRRGYLPNLLTLGLLRDFITRQYLVQGVKPTA